MKLLFVYAFHRKSLLFLNKLPSSFLQTLLGPVSSLKKMLNMVSAGSADSNLFTMKYYKLKYSEC